MTEVVCRACGSRNLQVFHRQSGVPANSCLLLPDREEAIAFPTGDLVLGLCGECGFIQNNAFRPELTEYSDRYEETQAFSPRFVEFASGLARTWVERYDLEGGHVVEIGCGKGEFLVMMAEAGIGSGTGIDPGVKPDRVAAEAGDRLVWEQRVFDDEYGPLRADAVVCRHTLEHIPDVREFLSRIRRAIGDRTDTVLLFELPDTARVLEEAAFWDVYYEHCSYFSAGSLVRLFQTCGFDVLDVRLEYGDQYLILEAKPASGSSIDAPDDIGRLQAGVSTFATGYSALVEEWDRRLADVARGGGKSLIWGASSKGVAFLAAVGDDVEAAVDINPNKHGMYMAGTGHRIMSPAEAADLGPDLVVVMNPIYRDEIEADLSARRVDPKVIAV